MPGAPDICPRNAGLESAEQLGRIESREKMWKAVAIEEEGGQGRYLQGGYVDWDEVHSFYRVLAERTGRSDLVEGLLMAPSAGRGGL